MLDLRRLQVFAAVAEEGSFTAAASRLYMTQSAVSQQMSALEREVGVELFVRLPRGIQLTGAGEALARRAKAVFVEMAALEQEMREYASGPQELRLGTFPTAGVELLPQALRAFIKLHPETRVQPRSLSGTDPVTTLRDGIAHLLLMFEYDFDPRPVDSSITTVHLMDDPLRVVLPRDHRLAGADRVELAELAGESWVVRTHRSPHEDPHPTIFRQAGFDPEIVFRTDDYQSLLGLVAAGVGVSLVPQLSLARHRGDIIVKPTTGPGFRRRIMVQALPEVMRTPLVADLVEALKHAATEAGGNRSEGISAATDEPKTP